MSVLSCLEYKCYDGIVHVIFGFPSTWVCLGSKALHSQEPKGCGNICMCVWKKTRRHLFVSRQPLNSENQMELERFQRHEPRYNLAIPKARKINRAVCKLCWFYSMNSMYLVYYVHTLALIGFFSPEVRRGEVRWTHKSMFSTRCRHYLSHFQCPQQFKKKRKKKAF